MKTATTTVKTTIEVRHTQQRRIRCVARQDLPEYGIAKGERFILQRVKGTTYEVKKITVVDSEILPDGTSINTVVNNTGEQYITTLHLDGSHECTCHAWTGHRYDCYHHEILAYNERQEANRLHEARLYWREVTKRNKAWQREQKDRDLARLAEVKAAARRELVAA